MTRCGQLLTHLTWPEWRHHPWRQAAALLAVTLGVALAFSVHLINQSALGEFSAAVRSINGQPDFELRGQRGGFDERLYERVAMHIDVALASPVIEVETQALTKDVQGATKRVPLRVLGIDALVAAPLSPALLPKLSTPAGSDSEPDRLGLFDPDAVSLNAAARQRLGDIDTLRLQTPNGVVALRVQGSIAAGGPPLAVMDIAGAQTRFDMLGRLSRIDVRLKPGADREQVVASLALQDYAAQGVRAASPDESEQRVSNVSRAYRVNLTVLALVALFTGAFLVFSILSLSVAQRQPQFALLGGAGSRRPRAAAAGAGRIGADRHRGERAGSAARHRAGGGGAAPAGGRSGRRLLSRRHADAALQRAGGAGVRRPRRRRGAGWRLAAGARGAAAGARAGLEGTRRHPRVRSAHPALGPALLAGRARRWLFAPPVAGLPLAGLCSRSRCC